MAEGKVPVIAITGSSGKSTTKEMADSILNQKWDILKSPGNKNLPLHTKKTMQQLATKHKAVLLELGMGRPGAGHRHCRHMKPDIVVYTNIGTAHYGSLGNSHKFTAQNKGTLLSYMNRDGIIMVNLDDPHSKLLNLSLHKGKVVTVGMHKEADYQACQFSKWGQGIQFTLKTKEGKIDFKIPVYGFHNVHNALFAIAIARQLNFSYPDIQRGLEQFNSPVKRLKPYLLAGDAILLDDSVSANPDAVRAAIDVLKQEGKRKKTILVIGSMLELGDLTEKSHTDVGVYAAQSKIDVIYTLGIETRQLVEAAIKAGFNKDHVHYFTDRNELYNALTKEDYKNSVILVKGSANTQMGLTAEFLRQRLNCTIHIQKKTTIK